MSRISLNHIACWLLVALFFCGCTRNDPPVATDKIITSFILQSADNPGLINDIHGIVGTDSVKLFLPSGTSLSNLVPLILFKGESISPASKKSVDFSQPVSYTVTAEDGSVKKYVVNVQSLPANSKEIVYFAFTMSDNPTLEIDITGTIRNDSVLISVPNGTNISSIKPNIIITGKTVSPANNIVQNFTNAVTYTITAEDGSTKTYKVLVLVQSIDATLFINAQSLRDTLTSILFAFGTDNGSVKWTFNYPHRYVTNGIAFQNGVIYTAYEKNIIAFDTATKRIIWEYPTQDFIQSLPFIDKNIIYINSNDEYLYAIDAITGSLKWRYYQGSGMPPPGAVYNATSPTVVNDIVYTATYGGDIFAINALDGSEVWRVKDTLAMGANIQSSVAVVNNIVYVADEYRNLLALNASDGSVKWVFQGNQLFFSSPTIADGIVYIGCSDSYLYALDANTGQMKWRYKAGIEIYPSPIVVDGTVYFADHNGTSSRVFAVDAFTGTLKWDYTHTNSFSASPVVFNETVFIPCYDQMLAISSNDGTLKWKYVLETKHQFASAPTIVDKAGQIFYPGISGHRQ